MMNFRLFHVSTSESRITKFHPLAHFGTHATAVRHASGASLKGVPRTLYEVDVSPGHFLMLPDLSASLSGRLHSPCMLAQQLCSASAHAGIFTKADRDAVVVRAYNHGPNTATAHLVSLLKSKGYNSLCYRNRIDDSAANDWILFDPLEIEVSHVSHWRDTEAAQVISSHGAVNERAEVRKAVVNARLYLVGRCGYDDTMDRVVAGLMRDAITGLDRVQNGLESNRLLPSGLWLNALMQVHATVTKLILTGPKSGAEDATAVAHDLKAAINVLMYGTLGIQAQPPIPLRTPFNPETIPEAIAA